jgi:hypothetical protein
MLSEGEFAGKRPGKQTLRPPGEQAASPTRPTLFCGKGYSVYLVNIVTEKKIPTAGEWAKPVGPEGFRPDTDSKACTSEDQP